VNEFFVAGIDGGQSSTTAVIGDAAGRVVGLASAGPADEVAAGSGSTRLRDALTAALVAARTGAGLSPEIEFAEIVAGISGYEGTIYGRPPELPTRHLRLMHDAPIAHAGALAGEPGITVIAGTGSVVYATGGSQDRTYGGWGYLFGDEGSAFWLVRETLAQMMRRNDDGSSDDDDEMRSVCRFFQQPTLRAVARAFYAGEIARDQIARFCATALGFASGRELADLAARRFAEIVGRAVAAGSPPVVALTGGAFADAAYREGVAAAIEAAVPGARIAAPAYDPSVGALLLAYRYAGRAFEGDRKPSSGV
jgi:glucosamine kinase